MWAWLGLKAVAASLSWAYTLDLWFGLGVFESNLLTWWVLESSRELVKLLFLGLIPGQ